MNKSTFALPAGYDWNIKTFTKQVQTITWARKHKNDLHNWASKLTTANRDNRQVIGGMLRSAYGYNIGAQIEAQLNDEHLIKIRSNIIKAVYY